MAKQVIYVYRLALVLFVGAVLLMLSVVQTNAQSCTNPGAGSSTDYPYVSGENTYIVCSILSAQATINAYTPTPTATLMLTPAAIATQTGCIDKGDTSNLYVSCVTQATQTTIDSRTSWWQPLIAFILFGGFALMVRRRH